MREYDEHIRLYTPVLQRIIILVAVVIAVPAVLWTITAFVRTYVAPPRVPTFQRMTMPVQPSDDTATPATAPQGPLDEAPAAADQIPGNTPPPTAAQAAAQAAARAALATATQSSPAASLSASPLPVPSTVRPGSASAATVPSTLAAAPGPPPDSAEKTDRTAVPAASDHAFAWPNATTAAVKASATVMTPAAPDAPVAADADASADSFPAAEPISGRVPLPPRRPSVLAMAQAAVPIPRPRPAAASSAAASTADTTGPFGWLHNIFQPQTPPQDSPQNP
jgi:hypothetical protein